MGLRAHLMFGMSPGAFASAYVPPIGDPPDTPVLSNKAGWVSGTKPPTWDTEFSPVEYNGDEGDAGFGEGDQLRIRWKLGAGSFTVEDWIPYWIDPTPGAHSVVTEGFLPFYPFFSDETLDPGGLFVVQVQVGRDLGLPTESFSAWSNEWSDMLPAEAPEADIVPLGTANLPWGFGSAPLSSAAIPCLPGDKLVVTVSVENNDATGWTVTAVDQAAAPIPLTPIGVSTNAGQYRLLQFFADNDDATSITVTVDPTGGGSAGGALSVDAIRNAAPGPPVAQHFEQRALGGEDPHDVDGGLASPLNGRMLLSFGTFSANLALTGAAQIAGRLSTAGNNFGLLVAEQLEAGPVSTPGAPSGGIGYGTLGIAVTTWNVAGAPPPPVSEDVWDSDGDSITASGPTGYAGQYATANPALERNDLSVGGQGLSHFVSRLPTLLGHDPEFASLLAGANDQASYANVRDQWIVPVRAGGAKVILIGGLPQNPAVSPTHNAYVATYNSQAEAGFLANQFDGFVDTRLTPMASWSSAYYADYVHPTQLGQDALAIAFRGEFNRLRGIANTPVFLALANKFNQVAGATVPSDPFWINGLGYGETRTLSLPNGGEYRVNGGAWASAPVEVGNCKVEVRGVANVAAGGTTAVLIDVDGVQATFTITTAGAAGGAITLAEGNAVLTAFGGFNANRQVVANFPAGRPIAVVMATNAAGERGTGGGVFDSVSSGGQAWTRLEHHTTDGVRSAWIAPFVQAEATAIALDVVRVGSAIPELRVLPMAAVDMGATGTFATKSKLPMVFRADGPHSGDAPITLAANGRGLVFYENDTGGPGVGFTLPDGWTLEKDWGGGYFTLSFTVSQTPAVTALIFGVFSSILAVGLNKP